MHSLEKLRTLPIRKAGETRSPPANLIALTMVLEVPAGERWFP
jgi:hypothetical protein